MSPSGQVRAVGKEEWVQTDPVTIIIGDSSTLLQRLASVNNNTEPATTNKRPARKGSGRPPTKRQMQSGEAPKDDAENIKDKDVPMKVSREVANGVSHRVIQRQSTQNGSKKGNKRDSDTSIRSQSPQTESSVVDQSHMGRQKQIFINNIKLVDEYMHTPEQHTEQTRPKPQFDCPLCSATFYDSPTLYKHIRENHGCPKTSARKSKRAGTIIVDDEGSMNIVGKKGNLHELNEKNIKKYVSHVSRSRALKNFRKRTQKEKEGALANAKILNDTLEVQEDEVRDEEFDALKFKANTRQTILEIEPDGIDDPNVTLQGGYNDTTSVPKTLTATGRRNMTTVTKFHQHTSTTVTNEESVMQRSNGTKVETIYDKLSEAANRQFNCPYCPRLFKKSSELYIHLQKPHRRGIPKYPAGWALPGGK